MEWMYSVRHVTEREKDRILKRAKKNQRLLKVFIVPQFIIKAVEFFLLTNILKTKLNQIQLCIMSIEKVKSKMLKKTRKIKRLSKVFILDNLLIKLMVWFELISVFKTKLDQINKIQSLILLSKRVMNKELQRSFFTTLKNLIVN